MYIGIFVLVHNQHFLNYSDIHCFNVGKQTACIMFRLNFGKAWCVRLVYSLKTCDVMSCEAILEMSVCEERRVWDKRYKFPCVKSHRKGIPTAIFPLWKCKEI